MFDLLTRYNYIHIHTDNRTHGYVSYIWGGGSRRRHQLDHCRCFQNKHFRFITLSLLLSSCYGWYFKRYFNSDNIRNITFIIVLMSRVLCILYNVILYFSTAGRRKPTPVNYIHAIKRVVWKTWFIKCLVPVRRACVFKSPDGYNNIICNMQDLMVYEIFI